MRNIIKLPIEEKITTQLKKKQNKINLEKKDHKWQLSKPQKQEITKKLLKSQGSLCCYCECRIDKNNLHREHFYERHDYPTKIYDYENMILSCQGDTENINIDKNIIREENFTCGHKKGRTYHNNEEIKYNLLLNPMRQRTCKLFLYTETGEVEPSNNCLEKEIQLVIYTVKRLNLDCVKLETRREKQIAIIIEEIENEKMTKIEIKNFINNLLDLSKNEITPYYSSIKDNFEYLIK